MLLRILVGASDFGAVDERRGVMASVYFFAYFLSVALLTLNALAAAIGRTIHAADPSLDRSYTPLDMPRRRPLPRQVLYTMPHATPPTPPSTGPGPPMTY